MKKNSILNIASLVCKFINVVILVTIGITTVMFIHIQLDRSAYENWDFVDTKTSDAVIFKTESTYSLNSDNVNSEAPSIANISTASLYFNYFKFVLISSLIFISLRLFQKVIASVRNLTTFKEINVTAFRRIGKYCLLIGAISAFNYWSFETHGQSGISINVTFFIIALLAFVLAEIFKEGNRLKQENELTI